MKIVSRKDALINGLTHYFTGKECPNGHVSPRFVSSYTCSDCAQEHKRRYRTDPDFKAKELAYKKTYNKNNRIKNNEYAYKKWRSCERTRLRSKERSRRDRHKRNEYGRKKYWGNREENLARMKIYRDNNKDYFLQKSKDRRAMLAKSEGSHTLKDIRKILKLQKYRCANCKKNVKDNYHADHIYPISRGGNNSSDNLQILCPRCNIRKHAQDPIEWAQKNGRLI